MRYILLFFILVLINNCSGYSPIFTSNQINFYIEQIKITKDDKLLRKIVKNLQPYTAQNDKKKISLELSLDKEEFVILRDSKGDPSTLEIKMTLEVLVKLPNNKNKKIQLREKFTFDNQSNKFELNQYKKSMESNLSDKIFENLILELRSLEE